MAQTMTVNESSNVSSLFERRDHDTTSDHERKVKLKKTAKINKYQIFTEHFSEPGSC